MFDQLSRQTETSAHFYEEFERRFPHSSRWFRYGFICFYWRENRLLSHEKLWLEQVKFKRNNKNYSSS